jgi:hypothetical protein
VVRTRVTLRCIAGSAAVGCATVSVVLRNNRWVTPLTCERVQSSVEYLRDICGPGMRFAAGHVTGLVDPQRVRGLPSAYVASPLAQAHRKTDFRTANAAIHSPRDKSTIPRLWTAQDRG